MTTTSTNHPTALIPIATDQIDGQQCNTVNARELHAFLEVKSEFRNWIKNRIEQFSFAENQDFVTVGKNLPGGGSQTDYHLTLDMAKELSMVERNDKGKEARLYFLACERQAKQVQLNPANLTRLQLIEMALQSEQERISLEGRLSIAAPIVAAFERIAIADGSICVTDAAKVLQVQPKALFCWMQANSWIYRRAGGKGWIAYQDKIQQGLLEHKVTVVTRGDGSQKTIEQVLVTPKGITKLSKVFTEAAA